MQDYISLCEAAKMSPGRPSGVAVWRWARKGIRAKSGDRIHLQHIRAGGKIFTTHLWLNQFFEAVAAADREYFSNPNEPTRLKLRTVKVRDKSVQQAIDDLERQGI